MVFRFLGLPVLLFCFPNIPYNRVLYSPRGSASQCNRPTDQSDVHTGQMGASASRALQRPDRLLQAALCGERPLGLRVVDYNAEWHAIRARRAEKMDRVQDLGGGWHKRRRRPAQLPHYSSNSRRRYVSRQYEHTFLLSRLRTTVILVFFSNFFFPRERHSSRLEVDAEFAETKMLIIRENCC